MPTWASDTSKVLETDENDVLKIFFEENFLVINK
jgi:hypothetical protein